MKIYKLIPTHEAREGDLLISTGANNFFGREVLNNEQALEYKPEDVSFKKGKPGNKKAEKDEWGDVITPKYTVREKPKKVMKWKQKEYRCQECEDNFTSDLHYLKVRCPQCGTKKVISI